MKKRPTPNSLTALLTAAYLYGQNAVLGQQTPLTEAVISGDASRVRALLAEAAEVNGTNKSGFTAFMMAAMKVQEQIVDTLLVEGADANLEVPRIHWTALSIAATDGNPKIIKSLIKAGARLDTKDQNGWTPIVKAALAGK